MAAYRYSCSLKRIGVVLTLLASAAFFTPSANAAPPYPGLAAESQHAAALGAELLARTNDARAEAGLGALEMQTSLEQAARRHALEMAELGFFSHTSPTPENATLAHRVARAGGFFRVFGENLAQIGGDRVAQRSVEGWLESPGHRANLLNPEFTHVGFGSAQDANGRVFVAQVFAYQPAPLTDASVSPLLRDLRELSVALELEERAEVALFYTDDRNDAATPTQTLEPGLHTIALALAAPPTETGHPTPLHLRLGVRKPGSAGSFIVQDDGWLRPDGWHPSGSAPQRGARVEHVTQRERTDRSYEVQLTFAAPPPKPLVGWWGDTFFEPSLSGATLSAPLPGGEQASLPRTLTLGEAQGEKNTYTLVYSFQLDHREGDPRLIPAPPQ